MESVKLVLTSNVARCAELPLPKGEGRGEGAMVDAGPTSSNKNLNALIPQIGQKTILPDFTRNYALFNQGLVEKIISRRENALPAMMNFLSGPLDEKQAAEGLYILDRMIDAGVKGVETAYPVISRFNRTSSPNIQVMLAGIYRKTQAPDGFGPLVSMLISNAFRPPEPFDPNEEVGGAILEYLRNKAAAEVYKS